MDITEELPNFNATNDYGIDIVENIKRQQDELDKKLHLFKIISFANELEDKVKTNFFERNNVYFINIICEHEYGMGDILSFEALNQSKIMLSATYSDGSYTKETLFFRENLKKIQGFNYGFVNPELRGSYDLTLELKPGVSEKIFDLFLSDELKKVLEYNKMQLELSESSDGKLKKMKV